VGARRGGVSDVVVLCYHALSESWPADLSIAPEAFERQLGQLAARGYRGATLRAAIEDPPGERTVAVTFDDGYRDFADHAWPSLKRHGVPVTLFVPTGYPDRPEQTFWWDRLFHALSTTSRAEPIETPAGRLPLHTPAARRTAFRALRDHLKTIPDSEARMLVDELARDLEAAPASNGILGWAELRRLAAEGVTMAPHTRTHAFLDQVPAEQVREEVRGSREDLERELGAVPPVFAFPAGQHSDDAIDILREEEFEAAFTTGRGVNDLRRPDWLRLRRINVGGRSSLPVIRAQLLSFAPGMSA
jgi:peptidoglycan/xylan/chitin deacetylase (PgdA/CDA1 family)